jgi:glutamate--cysteine ligase
MSPGGQLELATRPMAGPVELVEAIDADTRVLARRFATHDLALVPLGLVPVRPARRSLEVARYAAMERHFAAVSPSGLEMMNRTASLQLNVDFGADPVATWRRACEFAPVSHRRRIWAATDPSRTRPVGADPADWHRYLLDALVIPSEAAPDRSVTCRAWLDGPTPPTPTELDAFITTLFPPVRPRGYVELRMIDALPRVGRIAAIVTVWTLLTGASTGTEPPRADIEDPWRTALERGLADNELRQQARALLEYAATGIEPIDTELAAACRAWRERVGSQRTPTSISELLATAEPTAI